MKSKSSEVKDAPAPSPERSMVKNQIFSHFVAKSLQPSQSLESKSVTQKLSLSRNSLNRKSLLSASKSRQERSTLTLGPGTYSTESRNFSPSYSIGRSERFSAALTTPGPGLYDPTKSTEKHPAYSIGKAQRVLLGDQIDRMQKTPGPGDYSPEVRIHSPSAYLTGRSVERRERTPGPTDYQTEKARLYPKAAEYTIGKATRPNIVRNNYPGPCSYNTQRLKKSFTGAFSKSARTLNHCSDVPGPSYLPPSTLSTNGGVIGKKVERKNVESPGPGDYSIQFDSPSKNGSFGRSSRYFKEEISNVSPFSYSPVKQESGLGVKFSRSLRKGLFGLSDRMSFNGSESCIFSPGPSTYSPKIVSSSPRYSIGKSQRESRVDKSPGPGDYNLSNILTRSLNTLTRSLNSIQTPNSSRYNTQKFLEYSECKKPPPQVRKNNYSRLQKPNPS